MDTAMADEKCKKFFYDNFVICHLTVSESEENKNRENPGAEELYAKYASQNSGIPFWLIFDTTHKLIADSKMPSGDNIGCPASAAEVAQFLKVLRTTSHLEEKSLQMIGNRFRQNEVGH
jgi:hypothetical protein